jgi:hypothetical protein
LKRAIQTVPSSQNTQKFGDVSFSRMIWTGRLEAPPTLQAAGAAFTGAVRFAAAGFFCFDLAGEVFRSPSRVAIAVRSLFESGGARRRIEPSFKPAWP